MKKLLLFLSLILMINSDPQFASSQTGSITNYYYYNNSKTYLDLKYDHIYVKLNNEMSKDQFMNSTQVFGQYLNYDNFTSDEKNQVLKLNLTFRATGISDLLNNLKSSRIFECVSPVFSAGQQENSNQLIAANNEIIVQYKSNMSNSEIAVIEQSKNLTFVKALSLTGGKTIVYKVNSNTFSFDAANEMFESGKVNYAEPNLYITNLLQYVPNDPLFPQQWPLRNTGNNIPGGISGTAGCDMRLESAWNITLGSNKVKIAVIDTGIDTLHEDLAGNLVPNSQYNFINESTNAFDDNGHGTACAGIIAAVGNNSIGVSGVAPNCKIINIKSFNSGASGAWVDIAQGLIYAWQSGSWVCSNSWGSFARSSIVDNAILDGTTLGRNGKGTIYLFAVGNFESNVVFPASNPNGIAVGALSPCNQRKSFVSCDNETFWGCCYGTGLSIVAPGVKIYTTAITGSGGPGNYVSNFNGTSSATPNAAGIVALMLSVDSTLRWDKVREYLCRSADKVGNYNYNSTGPYNSLGYTWNNEMGYGKVNAYNAIRYTEDSRGFTFNHTSLNNTENLSGPYTVNSSIVSVNGSIDPAKTKIFWTTGNTYDSIPMTNSGGNNWTANIPGNGAPALYKYYIKAGDVTGVSTFSYNFISCSILAGNN